jgi:hypothetical protein
VPLSYSNTYGESLTGNLSITGSQPTSGAGLVPTNFTLNLQAANASTNLVGVNLTFNMSDYSHFNSDLPLSNTNYYSASANATLTLSNNVSLVVKAQGTSNLSESVDVKFTTDSSYIDCSGSSSTLDTQNHFVYSTITCSSSGTLTATINNTGAANGNTVGTLSGTIYNGTTQIGTVDSTGMIDINGTYYSLE